MARRQKDAEARNEPRTPLHSFALPSCQASVMPVGNSFVSRRISIRVGNRIHVLSNRLHTMMRLRADRVLLKDPALPLIFSIQACFAML